MRRISQSIALLIILVGVLVLIGVLKAPSQAMYDESPGLPQASPSFALAMTNQLTFTTYLPVVVDHGAPPTFAFISGQPFNHPQCVSPGQAYLISFSYSDDGNFPVQSPSPIQVELRFNDSVATTKSFTAPSLQVKGDGFTGQVLFALCIEFRTEATAVQVSLSTAGVRFSLTCPNFRALSLVVLILLFVKSCWQGQLGVAF